MSAFAFCIAIRACNAAERGVNNFVTLRSPLPEMHQESALTMGKDMAANLIGFLIVAAERSQSVSIQTAIEQQASSSDPQISTAMRLPSRAIRDDGKREAQPS